MLIYEHSKDWYIVQYKHRYICSARTREGAILLALQYIYDKNTF